VRDRELALIIDFGAQYNQLIARRVREARVYCEVLSPEVPAAEILARRPRALILTGGPASVYSPGAPAVDPALLRSGIPVLGICYGMQLMARLLGGEVAGGGQGEYGGATLEVVEPSPLLEGIEPGARVWMSHGDRVERLPQGFRVLARTARSPVAAMGDVSGRLWGVQFHPEVVHTPGGRKVLENFLHAIAGFRGDWTVRSFVDDSVKAIARQVSGGRAVAGLSGGVDSAVAAALVSRAIGDRLTCIFVQHGLLREGEARTVPAAFAERERVRLVTVDAEDRFLNALKGVRDPERKRKIIGETFIRVFEEEARKLGRVDFLVQGTIYPDVIESGRHGAALIKTHHNVGGLPERLDLKLVEPLRDLFKDEVRRVGAELGLPRDLLTRHPFPGPGLAVRVLGAVSRKRLDVLRAVDHIVTEEITGAGWYDRLWQAFPVLLPVRSVGVKGDRRSYGQVVAFRAVESDDAMTADWARLPFELLDRISRRVVDEVPAVSRVVYDISSKPPATIEWE